MLSTLALLDTGLDDQPPLLVPGLGIGLSGKSPPCDLYLLEVVPRHTDTPQIAALGVMPIGVSVYSTSGSTTAYTAL